MKKQLVLLAFNITMGLMNLQINAQVSTFGNGPGFATDYLGWNALQGFPVRVEHKGNQNINFINGLGALAAQRMTILGTAGPTQGFVGIGVTAPTDILHIHDGMNSVLHVTSGATGFNAVDGLKIGYLFNSQFAMLSQQENQRLVFAVGGFNIASSRLTILPNGNVGIGTGFITPSNLLDVFGGDIDVNTPTNSYMIADQSILWHKGDVSNLFVGVGAGQNHLFNSNSRNTFIGSNAGFLAPGNTGLPFNFDNVLIGSNAGFNLSQGAYVTIIGSDAGFNNNCDEATFIGFRSGYTFSQPGGGKTGNTFVGYESGYSNLGSINDNSFFGHRCGFSNTTGDQNSFFGTGSGENSTTGGLNSFFGNASGQVNGAHFGNSYFGHVAGNTSTGDENIFIGAFSGMQGVGSKNIVIGNNGMTNATTASNENVYIGYQTGLSGNTNGFNTILGSQSAINLANSNLNTLVGYKTAFNQTSGSENTYVGESTGNNVQSGTNNTFIGAKADATNVTPMLNNAAAIGANALVTNDNHMILGDNNVNVGIGLSGDPTGPGNKLEINTAATSAVPGTSGLRFTDLNSTSTAGVNPGTGVLSVDNFGDVIYVQGGSAGNADNGLSTNGPTPGLIHLGQNVGGAGGQLLNDREIPLSGFGIYFNGDVSTTGEKIEVGDNTILTTIPNRFNAQSKTVRVTGLFVNATPAGANPSNSTIGVAGFKLNGTSNNNIGVRGTGEVDPTYAGPGNPIGIGVKGEGHNAAQSVTNAMAIGVWGQSVNPAGQFNIGGFFDAGHQGGTNGMNVAIYGSVAPTASVNIAVYGTAAPAAFSATVPSGPFPVTGTYAGYFNGNVVRTGNDNFTSDKNLKQNIDSIQNAMSILNQLKPKTFDYKLASYPSMNLPSGKQYGLLAQDVEVILPELVNNLAHPAQFDSLGVVNVPSFTYKSLEYQQLIPLLIRGIQEQQKVIDSLKTKTSKQDSINNAVQTQIAALTSSVSSCCSSTAVRTTKAEEINQLNINLNDNDVIVLNQNVPNPFAEQTTITYNVPEKYGYAQIIFSTIDGRILKTVDITKKGRGQLNVFANDLGNGLYTYSLVIDGKVIDTKKMVKGE